MLITEQNLINLIKEEYVWSLIEEANDPKSLGNMVANFAMLKSPEISDINNQGEFYHILTQYVDEVMEAKGLEDEATRAAILRSAEMHLARMGISPNAAYDRRQEDPKPKKQPKKQGLLSKLFSR